MNRVFAHRLPLALAIGVMLLSGCATDGQNSGKTTMDEMQAAMDDSASTQSGTAKAPPASVSNALIPQIQLNIPGADAAAAEPRFDVKVRRAAARDFFLSLVEGTRYNMVVPPKIDGYISLDLKNVTVPEVMKVLRDSYGYEYERSGDNFQILPNTLQTRIYQVNYLDIKRSGTSKISAGATQIEKTGSSASSTSGSGSTTTATESSSITTLSQSDFWQDLKNALTTIIGTEKGRTVSVNPQSGIVLVRAYPAELREVKRYLDTTENVSQRQVILEARILEVELASGYQAGIDWAQINDKGQLTTFGLSGGTSNFNSRLSNFSGLTTSAGGAAPYGGLFTVGASYANFSLFIDLLKTQGDVHVLSSPRVSTVNNQKAVIKVGADEFFVTDVNTSSTTTTTSTSSTPTVRVEWTPFFSGVSLDVTPQIADNGEVILHVRPSVSEVSEQTKNVTVTTNTPNTLSVPLARSSIRESDNIVRANNGQIVIIGGLIQNRTRDEKSSVPLLGDIPGLGALFSHTRKITTKSELVILIKPIVVEGPQQWSDQLHKSANTMRTMDRLNQ